MSGFPEFIASVTGSDPPSRIEPGRFIRFPTNGKRGDDAGWCKLFPDGEGGVVGDFRSGETWTWQAKHDRPWTDAEKQAWRERIERAKQDAEAERVREQQVAARRAIELWKAAQPATQHPYLAAKGIRPHATKIYRGPLAIRGMKCDGALLVPLRHSEGHLTSLEFIGVDGEKRFLPGGLKTGSYLSIGKPGEVLYIAEGFATGASINEATGQAVAIAFDAGNLGAVAQALRGKFPSVRIVVAGDHDAHGTGQQAATEAAQAVGGYVSFPEQQGDDWNDVARRDGLDAVRTALRSASPAPKYLEKCPTPNPQNPQNPPESNIGGFAGASPATSSRISDWPVPVPLPGELSPVAAFDFDLLPSSLRRWVEDIAERIQCAPDFPAVGAVVSLASVIGRKVAIRPKAHDDWHEVGNLWGAIIGRPGVLKTPALAEVMRPLDRLEAIARDAHSEQRADWEAGQAASEIRRVAARQTAVKNVKKGEAFDVAELVAGVCDEPPRARRFITNDTTVEALGEILIASPNGVLAFRDELAGLLKNLEREGQEGARAFYLSAWTGKESHVSDRIGRGFGRRIDACCVSLLGSIQPAIIGSYLREAASVSGDDGLMSRFQLLVWPDTNGEWLNVDRWPDSEARREAFALFKALDDAEPVALGATIEEGALPYFRFGTEAQAVFNDWRQALENRIRSDDEHPALIAHLSKYRGLVPRLCLILHLADKQQGPIGKETLLRALSWAEYLETHARRAYASVTRAKAEAAKALLGKVRKGDLPNPFRARDVYQKDWSLLSELDQVRRAAEYLIEFGYLLEEDHPKDGPGRRTTLYHVNPMALS